MISTGTTPQDYYDLICSDQQTYVKLDFYDQGIELYNEDIDISTGITINDAINGDINLRFGRVVCKQMTTRIIMNDKTRYMKLNGRFQLSFGMMNNGDVEWVSIGYFNGRKPKFTSSDAIEYTAYDDNILYINLNAADALATITYPATVGDIIFKISKAISADIDDSDVPGDILTRVFSSSPFDGREYTIGEVLSIIAEACCSYIKVMEDGALKLSWFNANVPLLVTRDNQYRDEHADLYDGITWDEFDTYTWDEAEDYTWDHLMGFYGSENVYNGILVQSENTNVLYPTSATGNIYVIKNNVLLDGISSQGDINSYIKPIYDRIVALGGILPMSIDCIGNWCVETGDIIEVELPEDTVRMPIYYRIFRWNGSVEDTYETTFGEEYLYNG